MAMYRGRELTLPPTKKRPAPESRAGRNHHINLPLTYFVWIILRVALWSPLCNW